MCQRSQWMGWVLGALCLLYMGSLGTEMFVVTKDACNITAQDMRALVLYYKIWVCTFLAATIGFSLGSNTDSAGVITAKVLSPSIARILSPLQDSLSVIVICRFHLALQERVAHPNSTTHSSQHLITSFHAATRKIHNSLMDEFGDLSIEEIGTSEAIEPHREDNPSSEEVTAMELEEIPHGRSLVVL
ncbi:hypothetical protein JB92DRAFT_2834577 [Gautieria morchelliformis]|nr:hypothetical protein JB92DRAFT_2834577 [Gautieria morchelliformis]